MKTDDRHCFSFVEAAALPADERTERLGGKGAALARMTELGLPVPLGFTLSTETCNAVLAQGWSPEIDTALLNAIDELQNSMGKLLGDRARPLLVSVRSGAPISMPGMMDTVLNAGLTDEVAASLCEQSGNPRFGWDTARRFVQSYALVVCGASAELVAELSAQALGAHDGADLSPAELCNAAGHLRGALHDAGYVIPQDPLDQIRGAVQAVFASWNTDRAITYRRIENIADDLGTAATVQAMTFGNLGDRSGTGVAFTRDPSSGAPELMGDFLVGAQGEDVVAGTHSTQPITEMRAMWPRVADELDRVCSVLEHDLGDMADIEFTVEEGTLWLLQVRRGKRSPQAELRIAIDMAEDPAFDLDRTAALERCAEVLANPPVQVNDDAADSDATVLATGLAASPGRAVGGLCTDIADTIARSERGDDVVLIRRETSPADIAGMAEARGLLTTLGGLVSHAAVVARAWGVPAVVGAQAIDVRPDGITVGGNFQPAGTTVTVDGDTGRLLLGAHPGATVELDEVRIMRDWVQDAAPAVTASARDTKVDLLSVQRLLALKGMGSAEVVAEILGVDQGAVESHIAGLVAAGAAQELPQDRVRLLPDAIAEIDEHYVQAAAELGPVIEPHMDAFHDVNHQFKVLITSWQMRELDGEQVINDHTDADYDAQVIAALRSEIHATITPIIAAVEAAEARFGRYTERLESALAEVEGGDQQMMAHPIRDSYHTVWFELHEELIRLTGRNRADEAAAGRG